MNMPLIMNQNSHIVFFGGQGSRSLFSKSVSSQAHKAASSSAILSLLLSSCHSAFLSELIDLRSSGAIPSWAMIDEIHTNVDLLTMLDCHPNNPIVEGVAHCVYQLLDFLNGQERFQKQERSALAGFCSGLLPAVVAASSPDVSTYIKWAQEAVRLAFWIGYRAGEFSAKLGGPGWQWHPWAMAVKGLDEKKEVTPAQLPLRISGVSGATLVSITGEGHLLRRLGSQYLPASATFEFLHVHALYHGGPHALSIVQAVLQDAKQQNINFPHISHLLHPVWSSSDGTVLRAERQLDAPLVEYVLRSILVEKSQWATTWTNIVQSNVDHEDLCLSPIGPGSYSFLVMASGSMADSRPMPRIAYGAPEQSLEAYHHGFAITGMSINFPLGSTKQELWHTLESGLNALQQIPTSRFDVKHYGRGTRAMSTRTGNFLEDPFQFDHEFFDISPREAKSMDPQQKLLLHCAKLALDDAGYVPDSTATFQRDMIGCYIGVATDDYVQNLAEDIDVYYSTGTLRAFLSGKISYAFGFSGPSLVLDTACSSSLVAINQACRALEIGDCATAIAGGVNVITSPDMFLGLSRAHFLSEQGPCKAFDADADGYSRSEGCGLFVIKRLQDALNENDRIYGVIKAVEVNQSGCASSITHPHGQTQVNLFTNLLSKTGYDPSSISVIEAHGTGTQAGDTTELSSILSVFGESTSSRHPLHLTSIKANIGHAEAASGAASLAKLLLMLVMSRIPPQIGVKTINQCLSTSQSSNIHIATVAEEWKANPQKPRRALLNNFGAAGSNAALILQESPLATRDSQWESRAAYVFRLSAKTDDAIERHRDAFVQMLRDNLDIPLHDVCYTVTARRQLYEHRLSIVCQSTRDLVDQLESGYKATHVQSSKTSPVVFVFSGQGGCYPGMGKALLSTAPCFGSKVEECDLILDSIGHCRVSAYLKDEWAPTNPKDTLMMEQVACFVLEYALASMWLAWNIRPTFILGHSLGEYAALAISGAISLRDALSLVALRAQLMVEKCEIGTTTMLACNISNPDLQTLLGSDPDNSASLTIACANGATDLVVSGALDSIDWLATKLKLNGYRCKKLDVPLGFHSAALEPILEPLRDFCGGIQFSAPMVPTGSCYHGRQLRAGDLKPEYFVSQTRGIVQFGALLNEIRQNDTLSNPVFMEIGPAPTTLPLINHAFSDGGCLLLPSLKRTQDPWVVICRSLQGLALLHDNIDWRKVFEGTNACLVDVPCYAFRQSTLYSPYREVYGARWLHKSRQALTNLRPFYFLKEILGSGDDDSRLQFGTQIGVLTKYITGHRVGGYAICPASVYHEMLLEAHTVDPIAENSHCLVVRDMIFSRPLMREPKRADYLVKLTLERPSESQMTPPMRTRYFNFQSSNPIAHGGIIEHCSGEIAYEPSSIVYKYLAQKATHITRQLNHLRDKHIAKNHFRARMIYDVIFPRVVTYSNQYQSLREMVIPDGKLEAFGTFCVPEDTMEDGKGVLSPVFIDTLIHAVGFVANSHVRSTEACICGQIENCRVLVKEIDVVHEYTIYCGLVPSDEHTLLGEAYAMNSNGFLVAAVEGMHFKKVDLASFQRHLASLGSDRMFASENITKSTSTRHSASCAPKGPSPAAVAHMPTVGDAVLEIVSEVSQIPSHSIKSSSILARLGFDSLMMLELCSNLSGRFPSKKLNLAVLMTAETVKDLQELVQQCVHDAQETSSTSLSHCGINDGAETRTQVLQVMNREESMSPMGKSKLSSGTISMLPIRTASLDLITSILREITGLPKSDISPEMSLRSLGVDSLLSIELKEVLSARLGRPMSDEDLHPGLRLSDLERLVSSQNSKQNSTGLASARQHEPFPIVSPICLAEGSTERPPLLLFHDGSGRVDMYTRLTSLGTFGCKIFGIANPELHQGPHWAPSLVDMARHYASAISTMPNANNIILGGWSFGGVLAHEVARSLVSAGIGVQGVILIDSPCPVEHEPLPHAIIDHILDSMGEPQPSSAKTADHARSIMRSQFQNHARLLSEYGCHSDTRRPSRTVPYLFLQCENVFDTFGLCGVQYAFLEDPTARSQMVLAWEKFLRQKILILKIPGNHFELFKPEFVGPVSDQIRKAYGMLLDSNLTTDG